MEDILIPIFVFVVLPVTLVWLATRARQKETEKKAEIMLKAIEAGIPVNMDAFNAPKKAPRTVKQALLERLNGACITGLMGLAFLALGIIRVFNPGFGGQDLFLNEIVLPAGCVLLAVGIGLFAYYFAGKKLLAAEMASEEEKLKA